MPIVLNNFHNKSMYTFKLKLVCAMIKLLAMLASVAPYFVLADGFSVAANLNVRYNASGDECPDSSPLSCSGVVLRSAENDSLTWQPSLTQQKNETMAASYIRSDIGSDKIWAHQYIGYGIIYGDAVSSDVHVLPEAICFFPTNGGSDNRNDRGCGKRLNIGKAENLSTCASAGIGTADEWLMLPDSDKCSFDVNSREEFEQAVVAQIEYNELHTTPMWNEILIDTSSWSCKLDEKPISALFYHKAYSGPPILTERGGLEGAQYEQVKFYEETGRVIPIISISNTRGDEGVFMYLPEEQVVDSLLH